ncbi:DUF1801 domain-containing protein [Sphingopyxis sp. KK2]|uniref:DUF1801 domain-containing protein n=1 Tax=Sphingopyxis sp. KK2 TaxID=1855727 RepID=UPI00097E708E|nr:DUF1801 domain-containing protein [Sphingopyxis sp. KK2]
MPAKIASVEAFRAALTGDQLAVVDRLRALAAASADGVTEHIKWNAPSFCIGGDDRITLGLSPKGVPRVVLHRGVKAKDAADFAFDDPAGLVQWQAADRGVMSFASVAELTDRDYAVGDIFARWMEMTK